MTNVTVCCPLEDCSRTFSLSGQEPFQLVYLQLWEHAKSHGELVGNGSNKEWDTPLNELLNHVGERLV